MKILLLGGTGAIGSYLADLLQTRGDDVYVTSRSDRSKKGIHYIKGNARDNDFLISVLNDYYDAIVDFMVYGTQEFTNRVDLLLRATKQYFFFSSSRVYADSNTPIVECSNRLLDICTDREYLATDEYALT